MLRMLVNINPIIMFIFNLLDTSYVMGSYIKTLAIYRFSNTIFSYYLIMTLLLIIDEYDDDIGTMALSIS